MFGNKNIGNLIYLITNMQCYCEKKFLNIDLEVVYSFIFNLTCSLKF